MAMDVTSAAQQSSTVNQTVSNVQTKKSSSDSFKDEMSKISTKEDKHTQDTPFNEDKIIDSDTTKQDSKTIEENISDKRQNNVNNLEMNNVKENVVLNDLKQNLLCDISVNLTDDIWQMMSSNILSQGFWSVGFEEDSSLSALSINEDDAQFFINLVQNEEVNVASVVNQAQDLINQGVDFEQVQRSSKVSQVLLQALSNAREKNQPVRIDFDKNISVVLRVGQNGAIAAHFIPSDRAVEQYLRNNIESLKKSFDENDIPYTELSYSHSSKDQNQKRRNERQGE